MLWEGLPKLPTTVFVASCLRQRLERGGVVRRFSFKATLQALRQWKPYLNQAKIKAQEGRQFIEFLYDVIAGKRIPERPGRSEPRAVKRRPEPYRLLTAPKHEMSEIQKREKPC